MSDNTHVPIVAAVQFTGNFDEIERFVGGDAEFRSGRLVVATTAGPLWAYTGDWIVRRGDGSFAALPLTLFAEAIRDLISDEGPR